LALNFDRTTQFKKDWKRMQKQGKNISLLTDLMELIISENVLDAEFKNHLLSPKNLGNWECHIGGRNSDWLLVYKFYPQENLVVFSRTGSHSELFG
jgi:mRNA interferase YafQ